MSPDAEAAICVLGGGPAGAIMARRLAELGHDTVLIDRSAPDQQPRAESLAPSIVPILDSLQLRGVIEAAVFCRESRALLRWESGAVEEKSLAAAPSLLVERTRFDALLRQAAARVGVRLFMPARARAPQRRSERDWLVAVATPGGATLIKARFLVDARGKRHRAGIQGGAPRTAALSAAWAPPDRSFAETRIEAGVEEWFWGSPLPDGRYSAAIFLDAARAGGLRGATRTRLYRRLLSRSTLLKDLLRGRIAAPVCVRDATSRTAGDLVGNDFIRVGEAAFSIDPLSSQGIQRALLSAIQGSAAVHTLLAGRDAEAAQEFYRERQHGAAAQAKQNAARLYQARAGDQSSPFWVDRSVGAQATARAQNIRRPGPQPPRLYLSRAVRVIDVPVLCGHFITRAPALSHPALEHPLAYLDGIPLAPLVAAAAGESRREQIMSRWIERTPAQNASRIMDWMWAVGILVAQQSPQLDNNRL